MSHLALPLFQGQIMSTSQSNHHSNNAMLESGNSLLSAKPVHEINQQKLRVMGAYRSSPGAELEKQTSTLNGASRVSSTSHPAFLQDSNNLAIQSLGCCVPAIASIFPDCFHFKITSSFGTTYTPSLSLLAASHHTTTKLLGLSVANDLVELF